MVMFGIIIIAATAGYFVYRLLTKIIAIIWYFIDRLSLQDAKYKKAQNLFNAKDYFRAIKILNDIFDKHNEAPAKLAECKLELGQQATNKSEKVKYFNEVIDLRKRINNAVSIGKFEIFEANAFFEIAKIQFEETKENIDKLNQNIRFIDNANKKGCETKFDLLKTQHYNELAEIYFKNAVEKEMAGKISANKNAEAIQTYTTAKDYALKANNTAIQYNSTARIVICLLKLNENINLSTVSDIQKSNADYQKELYYRYAIHLLKRKRVLEAENIISTKLNFKSSDIDKLKEIIIIEKNNKVVELITKLNTSIEKLYNNVLSIKDLGKIYDNIDDVFSEVREIDMQLAEKTANIKSTLFSRLLSYYMSEEQFEDAVGLIQKYPKFWENAEMLKNFGICCYGLASKGLLNENNYKIIISGWLTAVFSEKVILKSLSNTSWDDNYTFTLIDSIGSNYSNHEEIPDNVNYDEVSDSNISIGAAQKELLQQFETIIHKNIQNETLSKLVNDFYDKEKEALEKIIEIIENDILFSTPHFAKTYGINKPIMDALDNDYMEYDNEKSLEIGVLYLTSNENKNIYEYSQVKNVLVKLTKAIKEEHVEIIKNIEIIENIDTYKNKKLLSKFDNLSVMFEDTLLHSISSKINEDDKNEDLISIMEECIEWSPKNEKLKYQYSNYVANYCISQVNDGQMDNYEALSLMKGAYLHSPNNPKICKNFITLIRFNLMDILNDKTRKTTEIYNILDWVKNNMSQTYKQNSSELNNTLADILQQFKQSGIDPAVLFLNSHYNAQGQKLTKVLNYFMVLGNNINLKR